MYTHKLSDTVQLSFPLFPMFARICVCVCVRASTMAEETTHPAVHVHDISVFVLRNLHDSLSLSLHLLVSVDHHPLFVSSELLNISLFFYLPSSTSLSQSRLFYPSFLSSPPTLVGIC